MQAIDGSLARLGLDYVDLVFCHRPDRETPIEETVWAMRDIIQPRQGALLGHSEWTAGEIARPGRSPSGITCTSRSWSSRSTTCSPRARRAGICAALRRHRPRPDDLESARVGLLTGKYNEGFPRTRGDQGLRVARGTNHSNPIRIEKVQSLDPIARRARMHACPARHSLVPRESARLDGDHRREPAEQVIENMKALDIVPKLTPDVLARIEHHGRGSATNAGRRAINALNLWAEEQRSTYLLSRVRRCRKRHGSRELFRRLAGEAEAQAAIWRARLTARGYPAPCAVGSRRAHAPPSPTCGREIAARAAAASPKRLSAMKVRGMAVYGGRGAAPNRGTRRPFPGAMLERRGARGGGSGRACARAALGVKTSGLVSNASASA